MGEAAAIFLMSVAACLGVGQWGIPLLARAQRMTPVRYEDCPPLLVYHQTKRAVPTMGGLFVLGVAIAIAAVFGGLSRWEGWVVVTAVDGLAAVGWLDDWLKFRRPSAAGLPGTPKLLIALAIGACVGLVMTWQSSGADALELPWLRRNVDVGWGWVPLAMLVVAGCAHAVNLSDGMDGLAAGCVAIALCAIGWLALRAGQWALVPWCASFAGACVGFLWFNSFPASVFLGDVGALGLGAALGTLSLLSHTALWLVIVGGVFVVEALSVMLQVASYRWRGGRRIFRVAPIHHHFHLGGVAEPKVIVRFWILGLILAALALTATMTHPGR